MSRRPVSVWDDLVGQDELVATLAGRPSPPPTRRCAAADAGGHDARLAVHRAARVGALQRGRAFAAALLCDDGRAAASAWPAVRRWPARTPT